jgi:excisionase family DNA binding protein
MPSAEKNITQIAELGLPEKVINQHMLCGLAEIAAYLGVSISTVRKSIKKGGLPAGTWTTGGKYLASRRSVDRWIVQAHLRLVEANNWDRTPPKGT